jgi:hypothetical protein
MLQALGLEAFVYPETVPASPLRTLQLLVRTRYCDPEAWSLKPEAEFTSSIPLFRASRRR